MAAIRKYYDTPGLEYFNDDSASRWVIGDCRGFTKNGIFMISESVRAYVYLILTSQGASRSTIIGNTGSALAAQQSFINNFENVINRGVDIQEDIKRYQDSLNYASSKVDYSVGQDIFMLPSDMNLNIGNVKGYNNEILVAGGDFVLGTNSRINHHRIVNTDRVGKGVDHLSVGGHVMRRVIIIMLV